MTVENEEQQEAPGPWDDLEKIVDDMEERVLGETADQTRDEDDDEDEPAIKQDIDESPPEDGPAAEPST